MAAHSRHRCELLVRRGYEAFIAGDMVWSNEQFHEDVTWPVPGDDTLCGTYKCREEVIAFLIRSVKVAYRSFDHHRFDSGRIKVPTFTSPAHSRRFHWAAEVCFP